MFRPICRHATRQFNVTNLAATLRSRYLHAPVSFDWKDPLGSATLFTDEELAIAETAESYCQERMLPRVLGMFSKDRAIQLFAYSVLQRHTGTKTLTRRYWKRWESLAY